MNAFDAGNQRMREVSGSINDARPLVSLLYRLVRDGDISPSRLETLLDDIPNSGIEHVYTNGWLARYAQDMADRLGEGA